MSEMISVKEAAEKMCIDHCHETGKVRGFLCNTCNSGIGFLGDKAHKVIKAAEYLKKFEPEEDDFCGYFYAS